MSGAYIVLHELKNQKTNSSFFGDIFQSGKKEQKTNSDTSCKNL